MVIGSKLIPKILAALSCSRTGLPLSVTISAALTVFSMFVNGSSTLIDTVLV
jgi:hypothetical protein